MGNIMTVRPILAVLDVRSMHFSPKATSFSLLSRCVLPYDLRGTLPRLLGGG